MPPLPCHRYLIYKIFLSKYITVKLKRNKFSKMCIFWKTKFLCGCIIDEFWYPCSTLRPDPATEKLRFHTRNHPNCKMRSLQELTECILLCELCLGKLHARVRKDADIRKTLASKDTFPLAEQLGMLILLENDEIEQWKVFGKWGRTRSDFRWEELEEMVTVVEKRVGRRRAKLRNGRNAWKYEAYYTQEEAKREADAEAAEGEVEKS
ncbi:uncharacterized protein DSM5745_02279 [Aspergillus mulundensis]|uniref:Uncharacterized protein n=1 Tax=Aspergillus mulundensis TaxID=1810919 RepID=A0A3D8SW49_9EURO|nr:hypothetical protein DSM5745_02279 [Aspergillus mulundensis]RDW90504.1 hypothetical protein DSM5745_02279 [Aspergillus mulundensis]